MHVSLNKKQKNAIVAIIISMSIIAVLLSKLINHVEPKTVTEDSIPKSTEHKEIPEAEESQKSFSDYVESYISSNAKIKEIELEVGEPIQVIKSESDIFEQLNEYNFTNRIDNSNKTIWGWGRNLDYDGNMYSELIIRHDDEGFNIEGLNEMLKEKGISIEDCDIKFYDNYEDDLAFKLFQSNKENLFLLKGNQLIDLSGYGISFYHHRYDSKFYVYSVKENKTNYISIFNQKNNTIEYYVIPFELKTIECAYFSNYNPNEVFVVAKKNGEENLSYYKINIVYRTIVEFETIKNISDIYPLQFSFRSDVIYNRIVKEIGDVYIIRGTDDGISGHHDHDYLYGVNKHNGQKIWSFYGNYNGTPYHISEDQKYITIINLVKAHVECFEIQTGKVMWEVDFFKEESDYHMHSFIEFNNVMIAICDEKLVAVNKENWENLWTIGVQKSSSYELIYKFSEDEKYVYYFDKNDLKVKCLEINTGKIIWERSIDSSSNPEETFNNFFLTEEVFFLFSKRRIIAFNTTDGSIVWERKFAKESDNQYKYYGLYYSIHNNLFVLKYSDNLIAIDAENGEFLWDRTMEKAENSYSMYETLISGKEILVLTASDNIYAIDSETGDIISEYHEEEVAENIQKVELEKNIMYLYSNDADDYTKKYNIETGEISKLSNINNKNQTEDFLEEALSGNIFYDGVGVSYKFNSTDYNYIEARDEYGNIKWAFDHNGYDFHYFRHYHYPKRIKNKVYISNNGATICVDALTGKNLYQVGKYMDINSRIIKLNDGIYWALGDNQYFDVYKID